MPRITILLVVACLLVAAMGVDPYVYGFVAARPTVATAFSSMFLHAPGVWHLGGNVLALLVFGTLVERDLGSARFTALFFAAGVGGVLGHMLIGSGILVGCSGALFGVMAACAMLRPRLAGFVVAFMGFTLWQLFTASGGGVSVGCHVGGFVVGFVAMVPFVKALRTA